MDFSLYLLISIIIGIVLGWLLGNSKTTSAVQAEKDSAQLRYSDLEREFISYKATAETQLQTATKNLQDKSEETTRLKQTLEKQSNSILDSREEVSTARAQLAALHRTLEEKCDTIDRINTELEQVKRELSEKNESLATVNANNQALNEKLNTQKEEIENMGKKFNIEFENIANKILEIKTEKFTELNKTNLKTILEPLGENIAAFQSKVEEVYDKESKERFSLGEKVKELAELNKVISEEAHNLTKALKGEVKTQGRWGEMILESILEKSGLEKGREYFMEHQLLDDQGNALKSEAGGNKMRPDAVIKYPDNRSVIIDSKVSLNAFSRFMDSTDAEEQKRELSSHVTAVKAHIMALSTKGYDDYEKALDFVMMFIPSEPAYIAALQGDPDIWSFAYDRRILLLNPTNLITSLKLIADLWKREYQNRNATKIAEQGAKLYDKFVGFISNLEGVGEYLDKAQGKYSDAYKQLSTGNDNLVLQATKLKKLGLKTKKELSKGIVDDALGNELPEQTE